MTCFGGTRQVCSVVAARKPVADTSARKIEYMVVSFNDQERSARLSLRQTEILSKLQSIANDASSRVTPEE